MSRQTFVTKEPVLLDGYQYILKPGKFGHKLEAIVDQNMVDALEDDRESGLKWAVSKLKNPKRSVLKPEPWEEVSEGKYKIKFSWKEDAVVPVVDTEGTPITDTSVPIFTGSTVKLAFTQRPYVLKDGTTYGTSLKLSAVQVVTVAGAGTVDLGDMDLDAAAALFGTTDGYKMSTPNVFEAADSSDDDDTSEF